MPKRQQQKKKQSKKYVNLGKATVKRLTEKAVCVNLDETGEDEWVPMSQVHEESLADCEMDAEIDTFRVTEWIAEQNELEPVMGTRTESRDPDHPF